MMQQDPPQNSEPSRPDNDSQPAKPPKAKHDRVLVNLVALAFTMLLVGAALGYFIPRQAPLPEAPKDDAAEDEKPEKQSPVRVARIERRLLEPKQQIIGRLTPVRKVVVSSEVSGRLLGVEVEEGDPVIGDQTVLARVDTVWPKLTIRQLEAQAEAIRAQLEFSKNESRRMESADDGNSDIQLYSTSQRENQAMTTARLEAELGHNGEQQAEQTERVKRSEILAPFNGTVIDKLAETGQYVSQGTPLCEIVSSGTIYGLIYVPEDVIELLKVDEPIKVAVDSLGETFDGTVASITPDGMTASRTFPVRIQLDDLEGRLKPGFSITVEIPTSKPINALAIPRDAALIRPDGTTVWVVEKTKTGLITKPAPVSITAKTMEYYAIEPENAAAKELLVDGAQVVIEGAERLRPENAVLIKTLDILSSGPDSGDNPEGGNGSNDDNSTSD